MNVNIISKQVYIVSFDPDRKVEGSTDTLCRKRKYNDNLKQLIFPHDILVSGPSNWSTVSSEYMILSV